MDKINILLIGSGGREHALAWKMAQSSLVQNLFIAPGNAGTMQHGVNVNLSGTDFEGIRNFVLDNAVKLVVVGPEEPLVRGIHDFFLAHSDISHIPVIGPQMEGARLEGSKDFAKKFMIKHGIPTAAYHTFTSESLSDSFAFLRTLKPPYVLKADGLAAGKGVVICPTLAEAEQELTDMLLNSKFGQASASVVIEEFLDGIELSAFALTNGEQYVILPEAKDYKRVGVGDTGPNTGGMGSISPVPFANAEFKRKVEERVVKPTIAGLSKDGIPFQGFLFFGLMNVNGDPFVIEYNVRLGDPETESVMPRIKNDLVELFLATANGTLSEQKIETDSRTAACIMLVSGGYPGDYQKNKVITGFQNVTESLVFHAGTSMNTEGQILTAGGRVIAVTSLATDVAEAANKSRLSAEKLKFEQAYFRTDIGEDLL